MTAGDTGQVSVNGRGYNLPRNPTVVFTIGGCAPGYLEDAMGRGIMPVLASMLDSGGRYAIGTAEMPTVTNVNNLSIVTGAPPAVHGIPGNSGRTEHGDIILFNDPRLLRAPSIHAALWDRGVRFSWSRSRTSSAGCWAPTACHPSAQSTPASSR